MKSIAVSVQACSLLLLLVSGGVCAIGDISSNHDNDSTVSREQQQRVMNGKKLKYDGAYIRQLRGLASSDGDGSKDGLPAHVQGGPAVAVLTTTAQSDIDELCLALKSLVFLTGDSSPYPNRMKRAPILVFNEGDLTMTQMKRIDSCTDRTVAFPFVELNAFFPKGFDPEGEWQKFTQGDHYFESLPGRARWSYAQMIRFWTTGIWKHPAIQQFDTIMRIDTDSCFLDPAEYENASLSSLPNLPKQYVYQSINPPHGKSTYVQGLFDFAVDYMAKHDIKPSHPELWETVETAWNGPGHTLPVFKTNFENNRREFFQSEPVMRWHEALTEQEPFGVWRRRWGDAQTRFLTMAMFGTPQSVLVTPDHGYMHGRGKCVELIGNLLDE